MDNKFKIFLFSSTHWDREWYQYFQGFRWRLVNTVDDLLDKLEKYPEFDVFTFDGQTIVLEDYLEIAPENKERLAKLIKDGRIIIGPWYVMPDEYLVSGESLIKNMLMGTKISKSYGVDPMKYGYICDIFGHATQTPQIFNGFGMKGALLGRGTNECSHPAHFIWQSPDGSECITFKLQDRNGYGAACEYVLPFDNGDITEEAKKNLIAYIESERNRSDVPIVLAMDGLDHMPCHAEGLLRVKKFLNEYYPNAEVKITSLEEVLNAQEKYKELMPVFKGEINDTAKDHHGYIHLITNTLSSRYDLKKANDCSQILMEKWSGPFTALANTYGNSKIRKSYYDLAYKYLIQNHPHDSICGCSIDQVHTDMHYRFDQVEEISNEIKNYAFRSLNEKCDEGKNYKLTVVNPLPYRIKKSLTADIYFDPDYEYRYSEPFGYEDRNSFKLYDKNGNEVPYKLLNVNRNTGKRYSPDTVYGARHTVSFEAELAPMGETNFTVVPVKGAVRYFDSLRTGTYEAENEFIRLYVNPNGTIDIIDKRTNEIYTNQLTFEDNGDIGDGWYHAAPTNDMSFLSGGAPALISVTTDTPAKCTFNIEKKMFVPSKIERNHERSSDIRRSAEYTEIYLKAEVSVSKSSPAVEVKLMVDNTAENHRLRLIMPTGILDNKYFASEAFSVVEREVKLPKEREMWRESCQHEKAMESFAYKKSGNRGLAFVSGGGLHEIGAFDDSEGNLAVTLLRSICQPPDGNTSDYDGQLIGKHEYNFLLCPLYNEKDADLKKISDILAAGVYIRQDKTDDAIGSERSFTEITSEKGNIVYSTLKPSEDENGSILRLYNLSGEEERADVKLIKDINKAYLTDLEENILEEIETTGNKLCLKIAPWKIVTVKLL